MFRSDVRFTEMIPDWNVAGRFANPESAGSDRMLCSGGGTPTRAARSQARQRAADPDTARLKSVRRASSRHGAHPVITSADGHSCTLSARPSRRTAGMGFAKLVLAAAPFSSSPSARARPRRRNHAGEAVLSGFSHLRDYQRCATRRAETAGATELA